MYNVTLIQKVHDGDRLILDPLLLKNPVYYPDV